mgnify:FL=1
MTTLVNFEVGKEYRNRKGTYEVLSIDGDLMQIRWKNEEVANTTVTLQSQIIKNIKQEISEDMGLNKPVSSGRKARAAV